MSYYLVNNYGIRIDPTMSGTLNYVPLDAPEFPAIQTGRLWAGLSGNADYEREHLFMDVMKSCRPWVGHLPGQWSGGDSLVEAVLDSNGYPVQIPAGVEAISTLVLVEQPPEAAAVTDGRYRFTYDGAGTFVIGGVSNIVAAPGQIEFDYEAAGSNTVEIRMTAITEGNHPRNMKLFKTSYASRMAAGYLTRPGYEFGSLSLLRFMDLMHTNGSTVTNWAGRTPVGYYTWNKDGMPIEAIVQVANELGVMPWVNIPHMVDDNYVLQMATYIRDNLNPALKCYIEWSNEIWNFQFQQTLWCVEQAVALWGGTGYEDGAWMQFAGGRAAQCMAIVGDVFAASPNRIVKTMGVHTAYQGLEYYQLEAEQWVALGNDRPVIHFDAYAVTGYFDADVNQGPNSEALLDILAEDGYAAGAAFVTARINGDASVDGSLQKLISNWTYHRGICNTHGLQMVMYEGGTHLVPVGPMLGNMTLANFMIQYNYSAEMGQAYRDLLIAWDGIGDGPYNHFQTIIRPTQYGCWGAMRWAGDSNPRSVVLFEYNDAPLDSGSGGGDGTPVGAKTINGYGYYNSLYCHAASGGENNPETRVANWIQRMALDAPNGGNTFTMGGTFGFFWQWADPPDGRDDFAEVNSPYAIPWTTTWAGKSNIDRVMFVPDNFDGQAFDPAENTNMGYDYESRLLARIDAWVANAPNPNRVFYVYSGLPAMNIYGGETPGEISPSGYTAWTNYGLGAYHDWMVLLVQRLQTARPSLDIRLHDVSRPVQLAIRDTVVSTISKTVLFEDNAPHGRGSIYFLLAVVEYMLLFEEKPPVGFVFEESWDVSPVIESNYQSIVDFLWEQVSTP